jgi:hypothetical protein
MAGMKYQITFEGGPVISGHPDDKGFARFDA